MSTSVPNEENYKKFALVAAKPVQPSLMGSLIEDFFVLTPFWTAMNYVNVLMIYVFLLFIIAGVRFTYWHAILYPTILFFVRSLRNHWYEKERRSNVHRIPFFADALANSLSVGCSLGQAFSQSIYYLRGRLKTEFEKLTLKYSYGKDIRGLLRGLDEKFPNTGLKYITSLLEEYKDMGIGIGPLLKKMAEALKVKEDAEEKIQTILSTGSGYARVSICVFGFTFSFLGFMLRDELPTLLTSALKPYLIMLIAWAFLGIFLVNRISSIDFVRHFALRPYIKHFVSGKRWNIPNLLIYSGLHNRFYRWLRITLFFPLLVGFIAAYVSSWQTENIILIEIFLFLGVLFARLAFEFYLKGLVEDQLIKSVEIFPDFLQVYIIGLNSGLNSFMTLQFAIRAIEGTAPELLRRELFRVKSALECAENNAKVWLRLSEFIPFEIIIDFCEIMVISPYHGSSIIRSLEQMLMNYQSKKMNLIEKKAIKIGQFVIPMIVIAFFPLFLFVVFGPLLMKILILFQPK